MPVGLIVAFIMGGITGLIGLAIVIWDQLQSRKLSKRKR